MLPQSQTRKSSSSSSSVCIWVPFKFLLIWRGSLETAEGLGPIGSCHPAPPLHMFQDLVETSRSFCTRTHISYHRCYKVSQKLLTTTVTITAICKIAMSLLLLCQHAEVTGNFLIGFFWQFTSWTSITLLFVILTVSVNDFSFVRN